MMYIAYIHTWIYKAGFYNCTYIKCGQDISVVTLIQVISAVEFSNELVKSLISNFNVYVPEIEYRWHIVFVLSVILSFCNSVLLSETLTLLKTFE